MKVLTVSKGRFFSGRTQKLVEDIVQRIEVMENLVVFPHNIEAEYGLFRASSSVLLGPKIGAKGSRYYTSGWLFNTFRKFLPKRNILSSELPLIPAEYRLELDVPGSGLIKLPGYRLKNGILLLYIIPSYRFQFPSDSITVGDLEDYAQLLIKPLETGFEGEVSLNLQKADYVNVAIRGKMVEDIIFFGDKPERFTYEFLNEPFLIVSHEKILDPPKLQKALNDLTFVSGHGDFMLKLEIGKTKEEMEFSVELNGE